MGMCFVIGLAAISLSEMLKTLGDWTVTALWVAGGLGFVVFVHELGHFLVAKACGVKCEKFYLGFDIGGWKLAKFQWGETEYGIGALPLGGYVKMLGQDDNPARAAEERDARKRRKPKAPAAMPCSRRKAPPRPNPKRRNRSTRAATWPRACRSAWRSSRPA